MVTHKALYYLKCDGKMETIVCRMDSNIELYKIQVIDIFWYYKIKELQTWKIWSSGSPNMSISEPLFKNKVMRS